MTASSSEAARTTRARFACDATKSSAGGWSSERAAVRRARVKQDRKHISGSKPNYRDMPGDVTVKEPSEVSLGLVSRNH